MGWRGNDNEFMVYSASTNFSSTNSLTITGKLSLRSGAKDKSTIVAVSDANGIYTAEVYAYPSSSAGMLNLLYLLHSSCLHEYYVLIEQMARKILQLL